MAIDETLTYLDHAATSWPKPPEVAAAIASFLAESGGNPGRSGHSLSIAAGRVILEGREAVAELLGVSDPFRVIFTLNATHALNLALFGLLTTGDRVITTGMEHNSMMRPLRELERRGVEVVVVPCDHEGYVDLETFERELRKGAKAACFQHASNVSGTLQPIAQLTAAAREAGAYSIVDAAQTAGVFPINVSATGIDLLAFTGHKGLQGPPGIGGLVLGPEFDPANLRPLVRGGTGSRSEFEEHPDMLPDRFEAGTPNGAGVAGLTAGIGAVGARGGVAAVRAAELRLLARLQAQLAAIPGVTVYGPQEPTRRTAVLSIRIAGLQPDEVGLRLDEDYGILTRVGLHCAPAAHRTLGTFPHGTIRISLGLFTTETEIEHTVNAVTELAAEGYEATAEDEEEGVDQC
ncbi:MAG: putative cysteine desulfurase [Actinobacteria bacterium ADurb.Bin444]|nr:MAG: putative cysteine desulfurase [Actinobacteria bacterium ADurb.Bin444]